MSSPSPYDLSSFPESFSSGWSCLSNIALVKYWGKTGVQLPINPSISFTLTEANTRTTVEFRKSESFGFELHFDGKSNQDFDKKMQQFFERIQPDCPFLDHFYLTINSSNTFPHSSGIASSASSYAALAMNIVELEAKITGVPVAELRKKASHLARLGSGSASRSVIPELAIWGTYEGVSHDYYASDIANVHEVFKTYQDCILIVESGVKSVSSTVGHALLDTNIYKDARIEQANLNISKLLSVLEGGNLIEFCELVEHEALSLHAMMMTSTPSYVLMKPNTLQIIERIRSFRKDTGLPVCFTLDAGANVHMLYPEHIKNEVLELVDNELVDYCENHQYLCDQVGQGPLKLKEAHA